MNLTSWRRMFTGGIREAQTLQDSWIRFHHFRAAITTTWRIRRCIAPYLSNSCSSFGFSSIFLCCRLEISSLRNSRNAGMWQCSCKAPFDVLLYCLDLSPNVHQMPGRISITCSRHRFRRSCNNRSGLAHP